MSVTICTWLSAFSHESDVWQGRVPNSPAGGTPEAQRLGLPRVSFLKCPSSDVLSLSLWILALHECLGRRWFEQTRVGGSACHLWEWARPFPFPQGCAGCTPGSSLCFLVMLLKGPAYAPLSPEQKPTQEIRLQRLSSAWLPGTPLPPLIVGGDIKQKQKLNKIQKIKYKNLPSWHFSLSV